MVQWPFKKEGESGRVGDGETKNEESQFNDAKVGGGDGEILNSKAPFVWLVNHVYEHADNLFVFIK